MKSVESEMEEAENPNIMAKVYVPVGAQFAHKRQGRVAKQGDTSRRYQLTTYMFMGNGAHEDSKQKLAVHHSESDGVLAVIVRRKR